MADTIPDKFLCQGGRRRDEKTEGKDMIQG
jgi:hypothetical protein